MPFGSGLLSLGSFFELNISVARAYNRLEFLRTIEIYASSSVEEADFAGIHVRKVLEQFLAL